MRHRLLPPSRPLLACLLAGATALACTRPLPASMQPTPTPAEATGPATTVEAVVAAARSYVARQSTVPDFSVEVQVVREDWARVRVRAPQSVADPAIVFLHRVNGQWQGVVIGTAFPPATYDRLGIPDSVRLPPGG